jgi:outer membrane protein assembly factor BamA
MRTRMTVEVMMTIRASQITRKAILCLAVGVSSAMFVIAARGQQKSVYTETDPNWSKTTQERDSRIDLAGREPYRVGQIYVAGNKQTRDREVRERLLRGIRQGDVFEYAALDKSLKWISKIKTIHPVTIENIQVKLDEEEKFIDFIINVEEREN